MSPSANDRVDRRAERDRFRRTLASVMTVQVLALLALWWLQAVFGP